MEGLILFLILMSLGYFSGRMLESRHYRAIEARERKYLRLPAVTLKNVSDGQAVVKAKLVHTFQVLSENKHDVTCCWKFVYIKLRCENGDTQFI